ncbi:MAG: glycosyltransferase family 4 protein [Ruminococcaceae bacterium]|nr:glycosyltransferase family 4 protein [Oscillospiraceae bacterium]
MSKVLFLVNHDVVIYNFRLELVERLIKEGHQVVISSPYGERIEDLKALGCEYREIELSRHGTNPVKELKLISTYKKLINDIKPDIVFSYTIKPNIYGAIACKMTKTPCVANVTGLGTAVENGGIMQTITVMLYKLAFNKLKRLFFQNEENMQFFIDKKITSCPKTLLPGSGVNLKRFLPLEYRDDGKVHFAFVSRIMKEKGIDQYLDAAKYIKNKYPDTEFHVCGFCEQEYEEELKSLTNQGVITYHGMVRDVAGFLEGVNCTVHPTYYPEGISNVLLESSACARPIITTDRAGCREVIDDGVNGYIVKQQNSNDLIEKIEKFLSLTYEERKNMGLKGREKVEKEFDRQIVVDAYIREL